jgi:peptide/nickel transport system permease protein
MTCPGILLALVLIAIFGPSLGNVMMAVGIAQAPHYARQARASTLSIREHEYVLAARAVGSTRWFILTRHVLPNAMAPVIVLATMGLGSAILDAAGLSYLGLSGDPSRPEWGSMLTADRERFLSQPWLVVAPGLAITASVLSFNILGDALRDRLDPKQH